MTALYKTMGFPSGGKGPERGRNKGAAILYAIQGVSKKKTSWAGAGKRAVKEG